MNRWSCFNLVCRGPFVSCANIGTFLVLTKQKAGWVRETDHIHYRKRKLITLRLRCESVSNSLNITRTKKKCRDNVVRTLWQPSDVQVVVRPVRCCKGCSNWWNFLTMTITIICCDKVWTVQPLLNKSLQRLTHHWEPVSNGHRIGRQIWLYINYEAESGYHFYLRSVPSFLMFPVSCSWMRVEMDGETDM